MTGIADSAPDQAAGAARPSLRRLFAATEIDVRLFGMLVALVAILLGVPRPVRLQAHQPRQHGHAGRAGERRGHHGHGHGPHHRVPQHRPVGRLAGRRLLHGLRPAHDRLPAGRPGHPRGQPLHVDRGPGARARAGRPRRWLPGLHHRLHRRALLRRHPWRAARPAGGRLGALEWRGRHRHRQHVQADRWRSPGVAGRRDDVAAGHHRLPRHRGVPGLQPAAATSLRVPARGRCGPRSSSGVRRLRRGARPGRLRQPELHAQGSRRPVGRRSEASRCRRAGSRSRWASRGPSSSSRWSPSP